jgi:mannose-1-phosphate guanylyltransferase
MSFAEVVRATTLKPADGRQGTRAMTKKRTRDEIWGVILAAGEGSRLAPLTRRLYSAPMPKQFARLIGDKSLLEDTVARIGPLIAPRNIVVVVPAGFEAMARAQMSAFPGVEVVPQPLNRGTGPGILLPLAHVLARAPGARVAVIPSDHYVPNPGPLLETVARSAALADQSPLTLLGVTPQAPETEYGWIRLGQERSGGLRAVRGFVEKPSLRLARALFRSGALWNTFIMTGRGQELWNLSARRLPTQAAQIRAAMSASDPAQALRRAYETMPDANFSHAVLTATEGLTAAAVEGSGWCDWGTPDRVFASLEGSAELARLRERMHPAGNLQSRAPTFNAVAL